MIEGGEFQTNITRFTLPILVLAFNKFGSMLAATGDDEGIKLINTMDGSIARVLKGHKGLVTGLAFDPKSKYFGSLDSVGTIYIGTPIWNSITHSQSLSDLGEDSHYESEPPSRKRLRKQSVYSDNFDEKINNDLSLLPKSPKKSLS
ncbi:unnamed protein product [Camellia sinensis]